MKQLVFIDDSGGPGFRGATSANFVMAGVLFQNPGVAEAVMREMDEYRVSLGWKGNHEFKFAKNPKDVVTEMLKRASRYDFAVYAAFGGLCAGRGLIYGGR